MQSMVSSEGLHMQIGHGGRVLQPQWMNQHLVYSSEISHQDLWPHRGELPLKVRHRGPGSSLTAFEGVYA